LTLLRPVGTLTNSQIEFFYARAAYVLLGEPVPAEIAEKHSVFWLREKLIDDCVSGPLSPVRGGEDRNQARARAESLPLLATGDATGRTPGLVSGCGW